ncbi:hypothetical protein FJTKL_08897 [Diaporthe vaccinii]|uniref:Uncharacterized protein n=1 Tax=Diaporthe vaccinii TaxID=105482 RepID=A0ABR4EPZ7_9PEZI
MSSAIHLFNVTRFKSEVKCVLYCVDRNFPPYTRLAVTDAVGWKADILNRLGEWRREIPKHPEGSPHHHMNLLCDIKYHELVMLVLRPNPRLQQPDRQSLSQCFSSAMDCCKLYHQLYVTKALHYGWMSVHSLFLCVMVMFYCVWTPQRVADDANVDCLMRALKASSDVLSAMGEYWPEATRSRDILDRVSAATIRRFVTKSKQGHRDSAAIDPHSSSDPVQNGNPGTSSSDWAGISQASESLAPTVFDTRAGMSDPFLNNYGVPGDAFMPADVLHFFLGNGMDIETGDGSFGDQNHDEIDDIMYGLFGDSIGGGQAA